MTNLTKILVVDDDPCFQLLLESFLIEKGFKVECVNDAEQMTYKLKRSFYDLILLDWMMPGEDGLSACSRLHVEGNNPPIIMLTANGSDNHFIGGLLSGADDYLAKPFNLDVLLARINAVLRRRPRVLTPLPVKNVSLFHFGPYVLDFSGRCLYKKVIRLDLSSNEFALLHILALHVGKPLSREQLSYRLKGEDSKVDDRSVDTQVYRLRQMLEVDPANPVYLLTVRGVGYVLVQGGSIELKDN